MQSTKLKQQEDEKLGDASESLQEAEIKGRHEIRVYTRRWAIAIVLGILIFSNSKSRIGFGPVAYTSALFYETEVATINRFALVYMVVGVPMGFFATWIMSKIGLRHSLLFAAWIQFLGSVLRIVSAIESVSQLGKLILVFSGHALSAIAQPFLMFSPTQVAANWFPDTERSIANSLMTLSNPLGILAANILSPILVVSSKDIMKMLIVYTIPAGCGAIAALFVLRSNIPPSPPSYSAVKTPIPFWNGLKQIIRNWQYWILFLSIGGGIGIYTALTVFLEQILCPWGYSDFFAGIVCGSCLVLSGIVGAVLAGKFVDRTKRHSIVAKVSFVLCVSSLAVFVIVQNRENMKPLIATSCGLIGFFGLPLLPLGNEIIVETTFPVEPATSTGLVFLGGQLQGMLLVITLQNSARPLDSAFRNTSRCHINESVIDADFIYAVRDMTIPCYIYLVYAALVCLCFVIFFRSANNRIKLEKALSSRDETNKSSEENRKLIKFEMETIGNPKS